MNALALGNDEATPFDNRLGGATLDEASLFSERQLEFLAERELVWMTENERSKSRRGTIIAASYDDAVRIAAERVGGERIIGLMGASYLRNMKMWLRSRR